MKDIFYCTSSHWGWWVIFFLHDEVKQNPFLNKTNLLHPTHLTFKSKSHLPSMAALSIGHSFHRKPITYQELRKISSPRTLILSCCQSHKPVDTSNPRTKEEESKRKLLLQRSSAGFEKFGKILRDSLSPKQKGDWKDLTLMSLSFAVYVYISQKLVCAYFAWMSMPKQLW